MRGAKKSTKKEEVCENWQKQTSQAAAVAAAAYLESVSESGEREGGRGLCSDVVVPVAAAAAVVAVDDGGGALVREAVSDAAARPVVIKLAGGITKLLEHQSLL